jgi:hypothetical protein
MSATDLSEVRRRAWATRRQKYGEQGYAGSYHRTPCVCPNCKGALDLIIRLHNEGVLSEGQVAKATGLYRIDIRILADEQANADP